MYPIAGREYVLSTLIGYVESTLAGSGACVLLEGAAGIGKSRLLRAVAFEAAERGLAVAHMRAGAADEAPVLREMAVFLHHVTVGEGPADDTDWADLFQSCVNPFVIADHLGEMIERATRRRPLLIILDDAQAADEISGVALQAMMRAQTSAPVLWLLARTPVPAQSLAQHALGWLRERVAVELHLGLLDDEAAAALCASVLGAKPDASVLAWAERCGGHPLLIERLMNAFMDAGRVVIVDGTASVLADRLSDGVLKAVQQVLEVVPADVRDLILLAGRRRPTTGEGRDTCVLNPAEVDALSAAVPDFAGPASRAASDVESRPTGWPHQRGANEAPPLAGPRVVPPVQPAGRPPAGPLPIRERCGCDEVGKRVLAALGDPFEAPERLARALSHLAGAGRGSEAGRLADAAARAGMEPMAEAQLTMEFAAALQAVSRHDVAVEQVRRTLERRDLFEADRTHLQALLTRVMRRAAVARVAGTTADARAGATAGAAPAGPAPAEAGCDVCGSPSWAWIVHSLIAADRFEDAETVAAAIRTPATPSGDIGLEVQWHGHRAEILMARGRLGEARVAAEKGLRLSDRSPGGSLLSRAVLARISLHDGDTATASEHLRAAERLVPDDGADRVRLDWALAQFHAACGRPRMAVQTLISPDASTDSEVLLFSEVPTAAATLVRLAGRAGLTHAAEQAAGYARQVADHNPGVASLAGASAHAHGLLRQDLDALRRAVDCYQRSRRPLAAGTALEDVAQEEQNRRHESDAVQTLGSALDLYCQCDARRDVARIQKKLRRLGAAELHETDSDRPVSGWESLTTAELRVVRAIVDGKTNKEAANTLFLSPHTVDSHLRRVFNKLGINTRVELTRHFLGRGAA